MEVSIRQSCRDLRKNSTPAEKKFWQYVRHRQFKGYKFNRQHPIIFEIDNIKRYFVADFYCHELELVVEIDGGIHETQKDYDELRTKIIETLGIKVYRFSNEEVLDDIDSVLVKLDGIIDKFL